MAYKSDSVSVILPLYSVIRGEPQVPERSGINQWNASGRERKFGEAYIPIPASVRNNNPDFFPERDQPFKLLLPSGRIVTGKVCQQGGKALMTTPNVELCNWLFAKLDNNLEDAIRRFVRKDPYRYSDLLMVGIDSVKMTRVEGAEHEFKLEAIPISNAVN